MAKACLAADGEGRRLGGEISKTYLPIAGRPLVLRTLDRMFSARTVDSVVLVIAAGEFARCESMLRSDVGLRERRWSLQSGGATRQQSAKRGLERVGPDTDIVIIHDGARPFVSAALIDRCVEAAADIPARLAGQQGPGRWRRA